MSFPGPQGAHTIRLISVYIPSLASGHNRGEPRVILISCRPSLLYKHCKLFIAASAESILSCVCLNTVCVCSLFLAIGVQMSLDLLEKRFWAIAKQVTGGLTLTHVAVVIFGDVTFTCFYLSVSAPTPTMTITH